MDAETTGLMIIQMLHAGGVPKHKTQEIMDRLRIDAAIYANNPDKLNELFLEVLSIEELTNLNGTINN